MRAPVLDFHLSVHEEALCLEAAAALRANRIDPKFLYVTPQQAELWRKVSEKHSPVYNNPEFARIYHDAFAQILERLPHGKILLVGLGCGTGAKELQLYSGLQAHRHDVLFAAIDISRDLVTESAEKLMAAGAEHLRSLVCDLTQSDFIGEWLNQIGEDRPRLITFFGLVPNLMPSVIAQIFRALLRPGDTLLASVHLAPVATDDPGELPQAMRTVLPQYDNPETFAWLMAALGNWNLKERVEEPKIKIGELEGIPAFLGTARWKTRESLESPEPLRLFYSLRYTPALFIERLRREGFRVEFLAITSCRQEAIARITKA